MTIPLWGVNLGQWEHLMSARDFKVKSLLTGMSMSLDQIYDHSGKLTIQKVNNADMASIWSQLFKDSFGYQINSIAVTKTMDVIDYFIAQYQGVPVGTAALYQDIPEVAGIHSIGIIPSERRKGFAQDLLLLILFLAKQRGAKYGVLQASSMGKALYLKTGFKEEIQIKNFIITKN
jgi:N-acetylglutamate synthase-like GNAT family acetyltransferase